MTMLIAFIHPADLPAVEAALDRELECLLSVTPMQSHGPEPDMSGSFRGRRYRLRRTRLRLEIAVDDEFCGAAARAIGGALSHDGADGDPNAEIFVIRTSELHGVGFGS